MGKKERIALIKKIQKQRGTHLISYITSTRPNLEVEMSMDAIRRIYDHLRLIGQPKDTARVDLFLHSNGGDGTVPWRLVTLIREYTNSFSVLVPFRAFSAATLTCLAACRRDQACCGKSTRFARFGPVIAQKQAVAPRSGGICRLRGALIPGLNYDSASHCRPNIPNTTRPLPSTPRAGRTVGSPAPL